MICRNVSAFLKTNSRTHNTKKCSSKFHKNRRKSTPQFAFMGQASKTRPQSSSRQSSDLRIFCYFEKFTRSPCRGRDNDASSSPRLTSQPTLIRLTVNFRKQSPALTKVTKLMKGRIVCVLWLRMACAMWNPILGWTALDSLGQESYSELVCTVDGALSSGFWLVCGNLFLGFRFWLLHELAVWWISSGVFLMNSVLSNSGKFWLVKGAWDEPTNNAKLSWSQLMLTKLYLRRKSKHFHIIPVSKKGQ